jgi:hypothetical protein
MHEIARRSGSCPSLAAQRFKGAVIEPGRDEWDAATQAFNTTVSQQPALVVVPDDVADVIAVVEFAKA